MSTTNFLLATILFILVEQFYPSVIETLLPICIAAFVLYGIYWLVFRFPKWWKQRKALQRQEREDEEAFWERHRKQDAIRKKYDPENKWNEATSVPREYLQEIRELNLEYRDMLQRRNGWTANDFSA